MAAKPPYLDNFVRSAIFHVGFPAGNTIFPWGGVAHKQGGCLFGKFHGVPKTAPWLPDLSGTLWVSFDWGNAVDPSQGASFGGSLTNSGGVWSLASGGNTWQFTQSSGDLAFTAVPEPTSALAGLLLTVGLLRRRRSAGYC